MKSNLLQLIKIEALKFLSSFNTKGKKATRMPLFYLVILISLLVMASSAGYTFLIASPFITLGLDSTYAVTFFAGLTSLIIFMTSLSQARSIYIGDDYDLLSSLPIKKRTIVASKIITFYLAELSFSLAIMIPHGIVMIAYANNMTAFLIALLLSVTLPIFPIAIAIFISFLITIATAKFKGANYIFVGLYAIVIAGFSALSMIANNLKEADAASSFSSIADVIKWINPSYYLVELSIAQSKLLLLAYAGANIALGVLSILFLSIFFDKLHEIVSSASMKSKYVRKHLKSRTPAKVLFGLEYKRLVSSKIYFINAIMGSLMCIMASTVFLISFTQSMPKMEEKPEVVIAMNIMLVPLVLAIIIMIIGMGNPSTAAINIEGKNFWLIKSLPVDYKTYLKTKVFFALTLTVPACLIASSIGVAFKHDSAIEIVSLYIIPVIYVVLNTLVGLTVAIKHPKLKWNSEAEAVKNSAAVLISLLIHTGITIVFSAVLIVFPLVLPEYIYLSYIIVGALSLLPIIPLSIYLNKRFAKHIQEIEDL